MEDGEAEADAHLHCGNLGEDVVAGGERVVEKVVVKLRVGGLEAVDEAVQGLGVALSDELGEPCVHVRERHEHAEAPYRAEEVEEEVAYCRAARGDVAAERREDGGDGRADVGAEDEGAGEVECNPAFGAHNQRYGKSCRGRLDDHREQDADESEEKHGAHAHRGIVPQGLEYLGIALEVRNICADHVEAHEEEGEADDELAYALGFALVGEEQDHGEADERQDEERHIDLEAEYGDNPRGEGRADIGAENHGHRLAEGHEACVDEAYDHDGRGRGALDEGRDGASGEKTGEPVARHRRKNVSQTVAGGLLEAFTHHFHAVKEQTYGTKKT